MGRRWALIIDSPATFSGCQHNEVVCIELHQVIQHICVVIREVCEEEDLLSCEHLQICLSIELQHQLGGIEDYDKVLCLKE
jgi:hypothetical protein